MIIKIDPGITAIMNGDQIIAQPYMVWRYNVILLSEGVKSLKGIAATDCYFIQFI